MGNPKNHECKSLRGRFRRSSTSQKQPRETKREGMRSGGDPSRGTEGEEGREGEKWGQEKETRQKGRAVEWEGF